MLTLGAAPSDLSDQEGSLDSTQAPVKLIPVTVLGGFLGSGKTTLLCQLLERSNQSIVAIVNDVASLNIDAAVVRTRTEDTIEFQNGCACCALGSDLAQSLHDLGARPRSPDAVVIEASGLGDPLGIAQTVGQVGAVTLDGIVTLVDAQNYARWCASPDTARLFQRQLEASHLVVLTKTKTDAQVSLMREQIGVWAPGRAVITSQQIFALGSAGSEILLGAGSQGARPTPVSQDHDFEGIDIAAIECAAIVDGQAFYALLDELPTALYRMKGWLRLQTQTGTGSWEVQVAGKHWRVSPVTDHEPTSNLVCIGAAGAEFAGFVERLTRIVLQAKPSYGTLPGQQTPNSHTSR